MLKMRVDSRNYVVPILSGAELLIEKHQALRRQTGTKESGTRTALWGEKSVEKKKKSWISQQKHNRSKEAVWAHEVL